MTRIYIGIALALALVAGVWFYGETQYNDGREYEKAQWLMKLLAKDDELTKLKEAHDVERRKREAEFAREQRQAAARIAGLIAQNAELRAWWEALVPPDAAAYAWGLPDDRTGDVPPGPLAASGRAAPGAAAEGPQR